MITPVSLFSLSSLSIFCLHNFSLRELYSRLSKIRGICFVCKSIYPFLGLRLAENYRHGWDLHDICMCLTFMYLTYIHVSQNPVLDFLAPYFVKCPFTCRTCSSASISSFHTSCFAALAALRGVIEVEQPCIGAGSLMANSLRKIHNSLRA